MEKKSRQKKENMNTNKKAKKNQDGFTLVELILYIALVSMFLTAAILFSWNVIFGREKSFKQQIVQQSARIAMAKIGYEIGRAQDLVSVSATSLVLSNGATNTTIDRSGTRLRITTGGGAAVFITSNQVNATNLTFTNLSSTDLNTKNIRVSITLTQANTVSKGEFSATTLAEDSFELKGEFNNARKVLISTSNSKLLTTTSLTGTTIANIETPNVTIDKMFVSWTGVAATRRITAVQIGAGSAEFSGSSASGTILELTNYLLTQASGENTITLTFNAAMTSAIFNMYFIMTDGSFARFSVSAVAPVFTSCQQACVYNNFVTNWTCRASAATCTGISETNVTGGNANCSGGANADTCCCI